MIKENASSLLVCCQVVKKLVREHHSPGPGIDDAVTILKLNKVWQQDELVQISRSGRQHAV